MGWPVPASSSATTGRGAVGRWWCGEEDGGAGRKGQQQAGLCMVRSTAVCLSGASLQQRRGRTDKASLWAPLLTCRAHKRGKFTGGP
jgi:hypothetical protein